MEQPVSILIAAHNELKNLQKNLSFILSQEYSEYEVIVVLDRSTDGSSEFLKGINDPKLQIIEIHELENGISGKKNALTKGIRAAKFENLLFTDADCRPTSKDWVKEMVQKLEQSDLVLGVSPYENGDTLLSEFIQFDTLLTAVQYLSYALLKIPYMGVGRNIAYKKQLFLDNSGFESHKTVLGGDDDLFVGEVASKAKVTTCTSSKAQTISEPKSSWKAFFQQKRRHLSVGLRYSLKNKLLVGALHQFRIWSLILALISMFLVPLEENRYLQFFMIYKIADWLYLVLWKHLLRFKIKVFLFPIYDILYVLYYLITGVSLLLVKKNKWN